MEVRLVDFEGGNLVLDRRYFVQDLGQQLLGIGNAGFTHGDRD